MSDHLHGFRSFWKRSSTKLPAPMSHFHKSPPLFFSPAFPSELIQFVIDKARYPAVLVICSSAQDFDDAIRTETEAWHETNAEELLECMSLLDAGVNVDLPPEEPNPPWLSSEDPMKSIKEENNVKVVFCPNVAQLRAWLTIYPCPVLEDADSPTLLPEEERDAQKLTRVLFVYNFLGIHRGTADWSAQGLSESTSVLIEASGRNRLQPIIIEPSMWVEDNEVDLDVLISQEVPILSYKNMQAFAAGLEEEDDASWITETTTVEKILGRWFQFGPGPWDEGGSEEGGEEEEEEVEEAPEDEGGWEDASEDENGDWEDEPDEDESVTDFSFNTLR